MDSPNETLITYHDHKSPISEAFRTLRTNLQYSAVDRELKTILVTSAGPGEGKSTISANLAIAIAQSGKKVIVADADLRRPVLHKIFGADNPVGMTNMLVNGPSDECILDIGIPNLRIITSGPLPPNPAEMLASGMMEKVIAHLKEKADIVLFDCPPVIAVTDVPVLSRKVDGVLLVVRLGQVGRDLLLRAKMQLDKVQARILGVVANGVTVSNGYGYYYYYY